jgi:hypothetical protein
LNLDSFDEPTWQTILRDIKTQGNLAVMRALAHLRMIFAKKTAVSISAIKK